MMGPKWPPPPLLILRLTRNIIAAYEPAPERKGHVMYRSVRRHGISAPMAASSARAADGADQNNGALAKAGTPIIPTPAYRW